LLLRSLVVTPWISGAREIPYSEFRAKLKAGQVVEATIGVDRIEGEMKDETAASDSKATVRFETVAPPDGDPKLLDDLDAAAVTYRVQPPASPLLVMLASWLLPMALIGGFFYLSYRRAGRGAAGIFGVGKSKATEVKPEQVGVTFADVGGADEAIAELREIIQFLKTPEQFSRLGGRIPKGVLLVGPPGTGKTLIAKATAGEAHVPFFETSGSEFVEMFVGVGAARVRDLFEQARRAAPAVVFIDEIDAIGQSRSAAIRVTTNDEREQTLNQLLAEIDGFITDTSRPVIIMAATNRPEILDPALLRAGRFDRQVALGNPDLIGRVQILRIHTRRIQLAEDFDFERAARMTPGASGADPRTRQRGAARGTPERRCGDPQGLRARDGTPRRGPREPHAGNERAGASRGGFPRVRTRPARAPRPSRRSRQQGQHRPPKPRGPRVHAADADRGPVPADG
jgi:cell division protease FtsH